MKTLCHLNIYTGESSFLPFTFIPTDSKGKVILTKEEIIDNTELQHFYNERFTLDDTPIKFEFHILDKELLSNIVKNIKNYLNIKPFSIIEFLKRKGFS